MRHEKKNIDSYLSSDDRLPVSKVNDENECSIENKTRENLIIQVMNRS